MSGGVLKRGSWVFAGCLLWVRYVVELNATHIVKYNHDIHLTRRKRRLQGPPGRGGPSLNTGRLLSGVCIFSVFFCLLLLENVKVFGVPLKAVLPKAACMWMACLFPWRTVKFGNCFSAVFYQAICKVN